MKTLEKKELKSIKGGMKVFENARGVTVCDDGNAGITTCFYYGDDGYRCKTKSDYDGNLKSFNCWQ